MYLRIKFQVSSIILKSFRQGEGVVLCPPTAKQTPKKPVNIRGVDKEFVKGLYTFLLIKKTIQK